MAFQAFENEAKVHAVEIAVALRLLTFDSVAHVALGVTQVLFDALTSKLMVGASNVAHQEAKTKLALETSRHVSESAGLRQTLAASESLVKVGSTPLP